MRAGITVSNSNDFSRPADFKVNQIVGIRNNTALQVGDCHGDDAQVFSIGIDNPAVRREFDSCGSASAFYFFVCNELAIFISSGHECAGGIRHYPLQVRIPWHSFSAEAFTVQEEFNVVQIAEASDINLFAFLTAPVPMRQKVEDGLVAPPGLIVEVVVLGKSSKVNRAVIRDDVGPAVLATIVKAGPGKSAGEPRSSGIVRPPLFSGARIFAREVLLVIVSRLIASLLVDLVNSTGGDNAGRFCADVWLLWMRRVILVH